MNNGAMERVRRLMDLWPYLPAFRAVAETQHLPRASELLLVSPSALSRSIRLLEEAVGVQLFDRVGRQLELNPSGRRFLSAVRDSMRLLDEGLAQISEGQFVGAVRVAAAEPWRTELVVPVLDNMRRAHPELRPEITEVSPDRVGRDLLAGRLDVGLVHAFTPHDDLSALRLGAMPCRMYCAAGHPLLLDDGLRLEEVEHAAAGALDPDPWPAETPRRVGLRGDFGALVAACRTGRYVAALPEVWAQAHPELVPVHGPDLNPSPLFAVQRRSLGIAGRAHAVVEALALGLKAYLQAA